MVGRLCPCEFIRVDKKFISGLAERVWFMLVCDLTMNRFGENIATVLGGRDIFMCGGGCWGDAIINILFQYL